MKLVINEDNTRTVSGRIEDSDERVDKDVEYDKNGKHVKRQYSMGRQHRFCIETGDRI